jgi:hypothetical protein
MNELIICILVCSEEKLKKMLIHMILSKTKFILLRKKEEARIIKT